MRGRKTRKTGRQPGGREKEDSGRKHLTRLEVEKLIDAAKGGRNGERDRCLLLMNDCSGIGCVGYSRRREARDIADSIEESNRRIAGRHVW